MANVRFREAGTVRCLGLVCVSSEQELGVRAVRFAQTARMGRPTFSRVLAARLAREALVRHDARRQRD
jgi:hypothetical protein